MATEYVVTDRTTALSVAIKIDNGQVYVDTTAGAASAEPIVLDQGDLTTYYKIFVDDGQIGIESTLTVQDDDIDIEDITTAAVYRLGVSDGQFRIDEAVVASSSSSVILASRRRRR